MKKVLLLLLLTTPAMAQTIPTEQQKHDALLKAYHMNGDSMKGWGSIDLSADTKMDAGIFVPDEPIVCVQREGQATGALYFDCPQPTKSIKIVPRKK